MTDRTVPLRLQVCRRQSKARQNSGFLHFQRLAPTCKLLRRCHRSVVSGSLDRRLQPADLSMYARIFPVAFRPFPVGVRSRLCRVTQILIVTIPPRDPARQSRCITINVSVSYPLDDRIAVPALFPDIPRIRDRPSAHFPHGVECAVLRAEHTVGKDVQRPRRRPVKYQLSPRLALQKRQFQEHIAPPAGGQEFQRFQHKFLCILVGRIRQNIE